MAVIPNQRKTYMMLSKENAIHYIVDSNIQIISEFDNEHTFTTKTETDVEDGTTHIHTLETTLTPHKAHMWTFRFPEAFINSKNKRWVEIHHCKATLTGTAVQDLVLHSDIIQRDPYLDHAVMNIKETRTKYKKYEYTQQKTYFTIWFTCIGAPETEIAANQIDFMIEMMLIY